MKQMIQPPQQSLAGMSEDPSSSTKFGSSGAGIDIIKIKQYLHIIVRRIWIVAICFAVALVFSVLSASKQVSTYKAKTSILLSRGTILPGQYQGQEADIFGDFIDTQIRIMYSRSVVARAGELLNISNAEVSRLLRNINIRSDGKASVIVISVESLDAQFSANFANAMAQAYIEFKAEERVLGAQTAAVNLTQQANKIREELKKAEEALSLFKRENSYVTALSQGNIAAKIMSDVAQRAAAFKLERMILEIQRPLLSNASDDVILTALSSRYVPYGQGVNLTDASRMPTLAPQRGDSQIVEESAPLGTVQFGGMDNTDWIVLKKKKSNLEHELRLARENLRDTHPAVSKLIQEIKVLEAGLNREVQFATEKYYAELDALSLKERSLSRVETMWLEDAMTAESVIDQYESYKNDVERLKKLLDIVFNRIRDIDISSGVIPDNVSVIEEAIPRDSPTSPRTIQSIFLAGLMGIGIGIAIIFALEFLDDSIRYPEDVSRSLGLEFLGVIPSASWNEGDIRTHLLSQIDPKSGLAEAYRNIRATLLVADQNNKTKTLLLTSSIPKEGKTTTSLNLAISFAQAGMRVLLVDADLRRGELHKFFGLEGGRGLSDVLGGQAKTESVIQRTGVPNLDLVATGPFPGNPAELVLRNEFKAFVEQVKRSYDKVVFDGPPVMAVSEAAVLASLIEKTVIVVWAGRTSRKLCQLTLQNLHQRGAQMAGCILNNLEFGRVGYYYYSTYYSYYNYDYRYDETTRKS